MSTDDGLQYPDDEPTEFWKLLDQLDRDFERRMTEGMERVTKNKKEKTMEKLRLEFYVAGVQFRKGWRENLEELKELDLLQLEPEPENKFDKNAVKILSNKGVHLGYVPAKTGEAAMVAEALRDGKKLTTTVFELFPDFEPWRALMVEVREVQDE
jgi:hypothetical protein